MPFLYVDMHLKTILEVSSFSMNCTPPPLHEKDTVVPLLGDHSCGRPPLLRDHALHAPYNAFIIQRTSSGDHFFYKIKRGTTVLVLNEHHL